MLVVYVEIVITGDDTKGIDSLKKYLQKHFQTKKKSKKGILLSQKKSHSTFFRRLKC